MKKFWKKILLFVQKIDRTTKHYESTSKIPSLPAEAFVNQGLFWAKKGEFEKAKEEFEKAISVAHPSPDAHINMGIYYARKQAYDDAIHHFRQAIKLDRYNARAYSLWASVLTEINEIEQAEKFYLEANRLSPRDADIYFNWGIALARLQKREDAYEKLKRSCFYNPLNPSAYFFWGVMLTEDEKYAEAIQKFNLTIAYQSTHREVYHYLAYCHSQLGKYDLAKNFCDTSLRLKNDWAEGYILAAEIDNKLGLGESIFDYYQKAVENGVESIQLYVSWIIMLTSYKKYKEAKEKCLFVLQINPLEMQTLYNLALCEFNLGNLDKALDVVCKLIEFYPNNLNAVVLEGHIYNKMKNFHDGIECYKKVIESSNKFYALYNDIANAYAESGDKESAVKYYEKAIEYVPNMTPAYVNCAKIQCELEDVKEAMRKIRKAYSLEKDNAYVIFTYAAVLLYDEKFEEALAKFRLSLEKGYIKEAKLGCVECLYNLNKYDEAINELNSIANEFENSFTFAKISFELYYKLAQKENSEYNINQALIWCKRVKELGEVDNEFSDKEIKLHEMSKLEQ